MSGIQPSQIREKIKELDLTYAQVYTLLGIGKGWFLKMVMENERYRFDNPDPSRVKRIWEFLKDYERFKQKWRGVKEE